MSHREPKKFRDMLKSLIDKRVEIQTTDGEYVGMLRSVHRNYVSLEETPVPPYQPGGYVYIRLRYVVSVRELS